MDTYKEEEQRLRGLINAELAKDEPQFQELKKWINDLEVLKLRMQRGVSETYLKLDQDSYCQFGATEECPNGYTTYRNHYVIFRGLRKTADAVVSYRRHVDDSRVENLSCRIETVHNWNGKEYRWTLMSFDIAFREVFRLVSCHFRVTEAELRHESVFYWLTE